VGLWSGDLTSEAFEATSSEQNYRCSTLIALMLAWLPADITTSSYKFFTYLNNAVVPYYFVRERHRQIDCNPDAMTTTHLVSRSRTI
jgi:hypothetical protein